MSKKKGERKNEMRRESDKNVEAKRGKSNS